MPFTVNSIIIANTKTSPTLADAMYDVLMKKVDRGDFSVVVSAMTGQMASDPLGPLVYAGMVLGRR